MSTTDRSFFQTILTLLDVLSSHKTEGRSWIHLLSLLCIFTILQQESTTDPAPHPTTGNPLQNLLGDLLKSTSPAKSNDTPTTNTLLSLLPLLNSPQIKSKLNPANIAAVMNVVQNLTTAPTTTNDKITKTPETAPAPPPQNDDVASAPITAPAPSTKHKSTSNERYLDWKSSF